MGEEIMILRGLGIGFAALAAMTLVSTSANAETVNKRTAPRGDRTVIVSKDEDGRTRTKIIVNRRSFLDPGTQVFPGENRYNDSGPALVYQPPFSSSADRGTITDRRLPLPDQFDLTFKSNPVGRPD
jgi:hypothetical protein